MILIGKGDKGTFWLNDYILSVMVVWIYIDRDIWYLLNYIYIIPKLFKVYINKDSKVIDFIIVYSIVKSLSRVWLFATPWTVAYQAP